MVAGQAIRLGLDERVYNRSGQDRSANHAKRAVFRQPVVSMNVRSSMPGLTTGDGLAGGSVELWPSNYDPSNPASMPLASSSLYDWGDNPDTGAGYGSMQLHNSAAGQVMFAYNGWGIGGSWICDLGIRNYQGQSRIGRLLTMPLLTGTRGCRFMLWTQRPWQTRVLTVNSSNPNSGVSMLVSPADRNGLGNGVTGFSRTFNDGTTAA